MSFVRRQGYVTHSCPAPIDEGFWDGLPTSRETICKTKTAKRFLESSYQNLFFEREIRLQRRRSLETALSRDDLSDSEKQKILSQYLDEERRNLRFQRSKLRASQFEKIACLGHGASGEVWLVKDNDFLYAMKILRKRDIIEKDLLANVYTERNILANAQENDWVVNLYASFQDQNNLYLVMEYMAGGDLMTALIRKGLFSQSACRFFAGEIALAIHSLHQMHFLHRDLKPDNILLDTNGHIKLSDFGLSRSLSPDNEFEEVLDEIQKMITVNYHVRTECCSYAYTAPEVLAGEEYSESADFWSLGVILYEMIFGFGPFNGKSLQETYLRVRSWKRSLRYPPIGQQHLHAVDLLSHLLCEKDQRFNFDQISHHPFFHGFNFADPKLNQPPMVPVLKSRFDTRHFEDVERINEIQDDLDPNLTTSTDLTKFAFLGFTFKQRPQPHIFLTSDVFNS